MWLVDCSHSLVNGGVSQHKHLLNDQYLLLDTILMKVMYTRMYYTPPFDTTAIPLIWYIYIAYHTIYLLLKYQLNAS